MMDEDSPRGAGSLSRSYFDDVYGANVDPWGFEASPYEAAKYAATVGALPRERYWSGFEIGCSIGVLTKLLAARCDRLLAVDIVPEVVARAAARCDQLTQVTFRQMTVPDEFPSEQFDLMVLSEVGYYWSWDDFARAQEAMMQGLALGGHLILVHWTPFVPDYPLTGDQVHDAFFAREELIHLHGRREERYRLDLFERR